MKTKWTAGLTGQAKEEMAASFAASSALRARQVAILQEKIESARKENLSKDAYESPNWAFKQADFCGYERAMQEIISLLS